MSTRLSHQLRDTVREVVSQYIHQTRPTRWEDDISVNTLDEEPFQLQPSPSLMKFAPIQAAVQRNHPCHSELLGQRQLADLVSNDAYPIPVADDREGYYPGNDACYWLFGLSDFLKIMKVAGELQVTPRAVLDFGCSSGRVLRHFAAQTTIPRIWGSDINRRHIRWLCQYLPMRVRPIFNQSIPSLPIADGSVDVISAFSVFTHIDTFETHWLAELDRILSPEGFCYITVHNEDTWQVLADQIENTSNRLVQSILSIDPTVARQLEGPLPQDRMVFRFSEQGPYRAQVFLSNRHLQRVWGRFFDIVDILPMYHQRQTVVVMRKRK